MAGDVREQLLGGREEGEREKGGEARDLTHLVKVEKEKREVREGADLK